MWPLTQSKAQREVLVGNFEMAYARVAFLPLIEPVDNGQDYLVHI